MSIRDIAGQVGIKESSIYNHFSSKQHIFDTIISQSMEELQAYFGHIQVPAHDGDSVDMYDGLDFDGIFQKISNTYRYYFENENFRMFRNILMISRFDNAQCQTLYKKVFFEQPVAIQTRVFSRMMDLGIFKRADAGAVAMEFYGPVFTMVHLYDSYAEVEAPLRTHLALFMENFRMGEQ